MVKNFKYNFREFLRMRAWHDAMRHCTKIFLEKISDEADHAVRNERIRKRTGRQAGRGLMEDFG